jgi:hypothetical protein
VRRCVRLPLRVLLPCAAVGLVACGAAGIGVASVQAAGGSVVRQADEGLGGCAGSVLSHGPVFVPGSGAVPDQAPPVPCGVELLSVTGQVVIPAPAGVGGPDIPASGRWLAAHLGGPVTVPGSSGGRWRVVIMAVRYQAQRMLFVYGPDNLRYLISRPTGQGSGGVLVVMAALAGTGQAAAGFAAAAGTVLTVLAAAAFAVTWAIVRPPREAAGPAADPRPGAAGAAARGSPMDMAGQLEQACLQLRRPAGIVVGFAEYCRTHGTPPPAGLDPMMQRVTAEVTQMETLIEDLRARSPGESDPPDRLPGPPAADPAAQAHPPGTGRAGGLRLTAGEVRAGDAPGLRG